MRVYDGKIADDYRNKFVETFVDCKSAYYQERIQVLQKFTDGDCYTGYLWDCLKSPIVDSEENVLKRIESTKEPLLVMWDIHSRDRIFIPNYWKYPKHAVLEMNSEEYIQLQPSLPEDHYVFTTEYKWTVAVTHEEIDFKRWCLFVEA